jgi:hypothetical protein
MILKRVISALRSRPGSAVADMPADGTLPSDGRWVAFITDSSEVQRAAAGERLFAPLASTRLRVLIPAAELAARIPVYFVPLDRILSRPAPAALGTPAAIVLAKLAAGRVAKMKHALAPLLAWLADRARSTTVCADLSDDYEALAGAFGEPYLSEYQRCLAEHCVLTVPCEALRQALLPRARRSVVVIEDPYESEAASPVRVAPSTPLRLCWFGNLGAPNVGQLARDLGALAVSAAEIDAVLEIVAGEGSAAAVEAVVRAVGEASRRWTVSFTPWSLAATDDAIRRSNFVLLPQEHASAWGRVKSHNRLVETIRGGRLAIASPIPSYLELAEYAWVGDSLADGLNWALAHPIEAVRRVEVGQAYVETRFAPQVVGEKWSRALGVT